MNQGKTACSRTDHPAGYIELAFLESSQAAVDQCIAHLLDIVQEPQPILRIFVNSRHANQAQPIFYLMRRLRQHQTHLKSKQPVRMAVSFYFMPLAQSVELYIRTLRLKQVYFKAFGVHKEAEAVAWLLEE